MKRERNQKIILNAVTEMSTHQKSVRIVDKI